MCKFVVKANYLHDDAPLQSVQSDREQLPGGVLRSGGSSEPRAEHARGGHGLHQHLRSPAVLRAHI